MTFFTKSKWFVVNSKTYMEGMNPSKFDWIKAYVKFMWISRNDKSNYR